MTKMFPFLPELKENETLYGWAARFHRLCGFPWPTQTSYHLFGDLYSAFRLEFPTKIEFFTKVTCGIFGDPESILMSHSNFSAYLPFLNDRNVTIAMDSMLRGSAKTAKDLMSDSAGQTGVFYRMRLCPDCIREDMREDAISTWHLEHLLPATWVCMTHGRLLKIVKPEFSSLSRSAFILPHDITESGLYEKRPISNIALKRLFKVARFVNYISDYQNLRFSSELLRETYRLRIIELGFSDASGNAKAELYEHLLRFTIDLQKMPGVRGEKLEQNMLSLLFNLNVNIRVYPTCHYLLMAFLFDSPQQLIRKYLQVRHTHESHGYWGIHGLMRQEFITSLRPTALERQ